MKRFLFILVFGLLSTSIFAQIETSEEKDAPLYQTFQGTERAYLDNFAIRINPLPMIVGGLQVDFEKYFPESNQSVVVYPKITYFEGDWEAELIQGAGLGLAYRKYAPRPLLDRGKSKWTLFGSVSGEYQYFDIKRDFQGYCTQEWDPVSGFWQTVCYDDDSQYESVHKVGLDFSLGAQLTLMKFMSIDFFLGGGLRIANSSEGTDTRFNSWFADYAFSGIHPNFGIAVGLVN